MVEWDWILSDWIPHKTTPFEEWSTIPPTVIDPVKWGVERLLCPKMGRFQGPCWFFFVGGLGIPSIKTPDRPRTPRIKQFTNHGLPAGSISFMDMNEWFLQIGMNSSSIWAFNYQPSPFFKIIPCDIVSFELGMTYLDIINTLGSIVQPSWETVVILILILLLSPDMSWLVANINPTGKSHAFSGSGFIAKPETNFRPERLLDGDIMGWRMSYHRDISM